MLAELGLEPAQALAAATTTVCAALGFISSSASTVTCAHDPREDADVYTSPSAVVVHGTRIR